MNFGTGQREYAYYYVHFKGSDQVREENEPLLKAIHDSYNGEVESCIYIYFLSTDGKMLRRRLRV